MAAIKGSLRMRRVLERASHDAVPGGPTELRLLYRGTLLRLDRADLDRIRRRALPRGARRNEVRGAGFDGVFDALWAQARSSNGDRPAGEARVRGGARRPRRLPGLPAGLVAAVHARCGCCAGWPSRPGCAAYANGLLSREEIALLQGSFDGLRRARARRSPTWRCWTSWTS